MQSFDIARLLGWPLRGRTIRTRLTVLYGGAFFIAGALLVAVMYFYVRQSLDNSPGANALETAQTFLGQRGMQAHPILEDLVTGLSQQAEQQRRDTLRSVLVWSLACLAVVGLVAFAFGWALAGRFLQPLQEITATARRVVDRNLHERISLTGPSDEIKELADTFDAMLERLDRAFDGRYRFVANASHELRTPLAINRTVIEVALEDPEIGEQTRRLAETLLGVNKRHERLIDGLLVLASSDQRIDRLVQVDLGEAANRAVSNARQQATEARVQISSTINSARVEGDPALLQRLIDNLVDNALRYNLPAGGWVHIAVTADVRAARVRVENSGPHISPGDVELMFEPFRRLANDDQRSETTVFGGAGLGLSIVRAVAEAHDGQVHATPGPRGGMTVEVVFPRSQ
ncbi:HAMP domain-containing sensor histidine kinase [Mycobacterium sp. CVI_P3]|uniref:histidine kinase n=1 Tax=Mycobacterium pinniadriaticum TaxID=2994102 RepID=A0ABT3S7Z2_9MYCO|nr:HAMP domain-containing sensor histidine kinase [Mycobacterium pinniadriaticum]MCX2928859.1 HAMP domain-containing sensor histidine kinase [Mycobacterium pinniadriaticum]MCX2935274.1 HAMP domain-containing sensor histidine kinase [Mycobacterium pinniadriaticum]